MLEKSMNMETLIKEFNLIISNRDLAMAEMVERNIELQAEISTLKSAIARIYADKTIVCNEDGLDITSTSH